MDNSITNLLNDIHTLSKSAHLCITDIDKQCIDIEHKIDKSNESIPIKKLLKDLLNKEYNLVHEVRTSLVLQ